jgi:uncharacterized protein (TIGR02453 family)
VRQKWQDNVASSKENDLKPIFKFLSGLEKNNNKPWFEKNRASYETAKGLFEKLVDDLILDYAPVEDMAGVNAKDCVMRIYRDIRFSKDKTPYKTNMAASIGPGGKKSSRLSYYLHLAPYDESMIAGGLHSPETAQLTKFRDSIARTPRPLKAIINNKDFNHYFGTLEGEKLKTVPQGYARDHPEIELLRMKEVIVVHHLTDEMVLSAKFRSHVIDTFTVMKPFLDYLNSVIN